MSADEQEVSFPNNPNAKQKPRLTWINWSLINKSANNIKGTRDTLVGRAISVPIHRDISKLGSGRSGFR